MMRYTRYQKSKVGLLLLMLAGTAVADQSLETHYWRAVSINGENLALEASHIPHIAFHEQTNRVAGFGGCNRFLALYEQLESQLTISVMGGGRAQCPNLDGLEQRFLQVLQQTQSYKTDGASLYLMRGDQVLGEFLGVER